MLFMGHVGISLVLVRGFEHIVRAGRGKYTQSDTRFIDYRVVAIGAILPDLIDKPIVQLLYGLKDHSGHLFAHSVLFTMLLILFGIVFMVVKKKISVLLLGVCSLLHVLFDLLILGPNEKLYWVFHRIFFLVPKDLSFIDKFISPVYDRFTYLKAVEQYFLEPYIYIFEVIGFLVIANFVVKLYFEKRIVEFIKTGKL